MDEVAVIVARKIIGSPARGRVRGKPTLSSEAQKPKTSFSGNDGAPTAWLGKEQKPKRLGVGHPSDLTTVRDPFLNQELLT
jgi:hypothetical protein